MKTLAERLKHAMQSANPIVSGAALAKAVDIKPPSVSDWMSGRTKTIRGLNLLRAAKYLNVNADWLAEGIGEMRPNSELDSGNIILNLNRTSKDSANYFPDDLDSRQYITVQRITLNSKSRLIIPLMHERSNSHQLVWVKEKGLNPTKLSCIEMSDDSMKPTLPKHSLVTVDSSHNKISTVVSGRVYSIRYGYELKIKRLFLRYDGALILHNDNPKFEREIVKPDQLTHIGIHGLYVAHSYEGEI